MVITGNFPYNDRYADSIRRCAVCALGYGLQPGNACRRRKWVIFQQRGGHLKKMILPLENRGELLNALPQKAPQCIRENYT